jgi:hypothetical protein
VLLARRRFREGNVMLHLDRSMRAFRFGGIVAAAVVALAVATRGACAESGANGANGEGGGGGDNTGGDCKFDVKPVPAESTCLRSTWCGGAGGTISYHGVTVGSSTAGSVECCLTELVVPAHTAVVKGDKKLVHVGDVQGLLITRRCTSPFILFWISFGSWTCETDSISAFGSYSIDSTQDCE